MSKRRIIIVGGGFGGVKCAKVLSGNLDMKETEIVLFNNENHLVFSPLLAEVVGSSINSLDIVVPLRQLLPRVFCRTEQVSEVDLARNEVVYVQENNQPGRMACDHLVLACGNRTNLNVVPGMADHAFALKTVGDAANLRSHIIEQLEKAEVSSDPARKRWHLTFIIVGGGFSGAEAAGEINDLVRGTTKYFRGFGPSDVKVILLHSRDQILPEISPRLRDFARRKMEKAGVTIRLGARVSLATPEGVGLEGGEFVAGGTIVCTVGSSSTEFVERLSVEKQKGRIVTEPDMRVKGCERAWAIGDCAWIVNAHDGQPSPTTGQFAERQGRQCAENILRHLRGKAAQPFRFKPLGELCSIGGHSAVADLFGMQLSGFVAWFVWRGVYLFKLPTWGRRVQVGFDWAWLLLFPRDLAHVRTQQTDRVFRAHYATGDFVFHAGDPPANFYVIDKGEAEVLRHAPNDGAGETIAVLGAGSFFGEKALLNNRPRVMSVRARSPLDVLVLGKNVFTQMSGSLAPLRDALAQTLNRRSLDVWKSNPEVGKLLEGVKVQELLEPVPQPLLKSTVTLQEVGRAFVDSRNDFFYVSDDGETLEGVVTITDLLRGRSMGAGASTPVAEFMTKKPVPILRDDTCATAAAMFREYRLKTLPVLESREHRRLIGCLRVRRLMAFLFQRMPADQFS